MQVQDSQVQFAHCPFLHDSQLHVQVVFFIMFYLRVKVTYKTLNSQERFKIYVKYFNLFF